MNWFKAKFIVHLSEKVRCREAGATFVLSVMLGTLAIGGAFLAMAKANDSKTKAIANSSIKQAIGITEAGIAKSLSTFTQNNNQYLLFGSYDGSSWTAPTSTQLDLDGDGAYTDDIEIINTNGCSTQQGVTKLDTKPDPLAYITDVINNNTFISDIESTTVGSGNSAGTYQVVGYQFDQGTRSGTLQIQGSNVQNTANQAQYQVKLPLAPIKPPVASSSATNAAALLGADIDTQGMAIFANTIICSDSVTAGSCGNDQNISTSLCTDGVVEIDASVNYNSLTPQELPKYNTLQTLLGSTSNGFRAPDNQTVSKIVINPTTIPPIPTAPTGTNIVNVDIGTGNVGTVVAQNPNQMIALHNSVSNNYVQNIFASTFGKFWQWFAQPVYANTTFDNSSYVTNAQNALSQTQSATNQTQTSVITIDGYNVSYPNNNIITNSLATAQTALTDAQNAVNDAQIAVNDAHNSTNATEANAAVNNANNALGVAQNAATVAANEEANALAATSNNTGGGNTNTGNTNTNAGSIVTTSSSASINLAQAPFANSFVEEMVDGQLYHAIYIQITNMANRAGDINLVIDEAAIESLVDVNGNNLDSEKLIVRMYINEDITIAGNNAIQVYSGINNRLEGDTERERNKIAALRLLGGNADGSGVGNLNWDLSGAGCVMAHVHGPTVNFTLPQGNGCDNSNSEVPLSINSIAQDDYGSGNVISINSNLETPHLYGAVWAKNITNNSSSNTSFYENTSLTQVLAGEFATTFPTVMGESPSSTNVQMSSLSSITRQVAQ